MSGIYIKGIEMPRRCIACPIGFFDNEYDILHCPLTGEEFHSTDFVYKRSENCPLIPAADVRPVVLCKDCKYSYDSVGGWCCSHGICVDCIVREDFFCADGERRSDPTIIQADKEALDT